jgi:hypothetical protein
MHPIFLLQKNGHVYKDSVVWKQILESETKNLKPKMGINVAMVE